MSDSDEGGRNKALNEGLGVGLAILLSCVLVGYLAYLHGYQSEARDNRSYEYTQVAKRNSLIACKDAEVGAFADCIYDEMSSAREQAQSDQDLDAQQWMARWAAILTIISALTTLISWIALRYLRDTFLKTAEMAREARDATAAMVRQNVLTEQAQRPWLSVEIASMGPLAVKGGNTWLSSSLKVRNTGQSPAIYVVPNACLERQREGRIDFEEFIAPSNETLRYQSLALAPGQSLLINHESKLDLSGYTERGFTQNGGWPSYLLGLVYQQTDAPIWRYTIMEVTAHPEKMWAASKGTMTDFSVSKTFMR